MVVPRIGLEELVKQIGRLSITLRVILGLGGCIFLLGRFATNDEVNRARGQRQRQRKAEHSENKRRTQCLLFAGPDLLALA